MRGRRGCGLRNDLEDREERDAKDFDFCGFAVCLFVGRSASMALAQEGISGDAAATYQWVHTNAGPGQCGCFGLNGGGISGSWNANGPWSVVADFSSGVAKGAPTAGSSLTLTSFLPARDTNYRDCVAPGFMERIACSRSRKFWLARRTLVEAQLDLEMERIGLPFGSVEGWTFRSADDFQCEARSITLRRRS